MLFWYLAKTVSKSFSDTLVKMIFFLAIWLTISSSYMAVCAVSLGWIEMVRKSSKSVVFRVKCSDKGWRMFWLYLSWASA